MLKGMTSMTHELQIQKNIMQGDDRAKKKWK